MKNWIFPKNQMRWLGTMAIWWCVLHRCWDVEALLFLVEKKDVHFCTRFWPRLGALLRRRNLAVGNQLSDGSLKVPLFNREFKHHKPCQSWPFITQQYQSPVMFSKRFRANLGVPVPTHGWCCFLLARGKKRAGIRKPWKWLRPTTTSCCTLVVSPEALGWKP